MIILGLAQLLAPAAMITGAGNGGGSLPVGWVAVILQGLLAAGFFMAGRASMSENGS
jgi:hypothetical protein